MKSIAITGGKGGTGKSTFAILLALNLSKNNKVVLCDCDAECPNDHIILGKRLYKKRKVEVIFPEIVEENCIGCGECSDVCRSGAVFFIKGKKPEILYNLCNGCGSCWLKCQNGAIKQTKKTIGYTYSTKVNKNLWLVSGVLDPGVEDSVPVVKSAKQRAAKITSETSADYLIIDTAAGTHCNVVQALIGMDIAYTVTEPTPVGAHDLELIMKVLQIMKIESNVIINRSDVGDSRDIKKIAGKFKADIPLEIPYSKKIFQAYSNSQLEGLHENFLKRFNI